MPTYDYRCNGCKHEFEHYQSMKDKPLKKCPSCGKNTLERLIGTGAAVIFKGSGFYQTDYRSEGYKKAAEADKPSEAAKSDTKADSKSESKPDSKADAKPETKAESKSEPKSESKPVSEPKPERKAPVKIEAKPTPRSKTAKK